MKKAAELWGNMTDSEKKPFEKINADARKIYEAQIEEFLYKGYFTLKDGTKSYEQDPSSQKTKKKAKV